MKRLFLFAVPCALPLALLSAASCGGRTGLSLLADGPIDATATVPILPSDDAAVDARIDAAPPGPPPLCAGESALLIYAVTNTNELLRFDPATATFHMIAILNCEGATYPYAQSMAVDHTGVAYVLYGTLGGTSGTVFRVNLGNAECVPTTLDASAPNFGSFGMGFSTDDGGLTETLYLGGDNPDGAVLGAVNEKTLALTTVGQFSPTIIDPELAGTGDGRLFAFYAANGNYSPGAYVAEIDKRDAHILSKYSLPSVEQGHGWAFAFWGGAFYLFSAPGGSSVVTRFDPADGGSGIIASYEGIIVGAGASTCAPLQ